MPTSDVVSGGRLDLGVGSGSYQPEHVGAGLPSGTAADRAERLAETLELLSSDVLPSSEPPSASRRTRRRSSRLEVDDAGLRRVHMSNVAATRTSRSTLRSDPGPPA
jgi:alkanesulfonate monooxygenase SsuD/methylene tetrahydromethanopterin reductase-like flavin-dependent oxidoreductase (luciferase family)